MESINWRGRYNILSPGTITDYTVEELFTMADYLAATEGNPAGFAAKEKIYFSFLPFHPNLTIADKFKINVYQWDLKRRKGNIDLAKKELEGLEIPDGVDDSEIAVYYQALGQCYLKGGEKEKALETEKKILELGDFNNFPVDKILYFWETFFDMKIQNNELDAELGFYFNAYHELLEKSDLDEKVEMRAKALLNRNRGDASLALGYYMAAQNYYIKYYENGPSERQKADAVLRLLIMDTKKLLDSKISDLNELTEYFFKHHDKLLPTDVATIRKDYLTVCIRLGIECM